MAHTESSVTELTYAGRTIGSAVVTTRRLGQEDPNTSDQVKVEVELELPPASDSAPQTLHPELQFETLINVFTADLVSAWSSITGRVARTAEYTGTDYATLFVTAQAFAAVELAKITDALTARDNALTAAG